MPRITWYSHQGIFRSQNVTEVQAHDACFWFTGARAAQTSLGVSERLCVYSRGSDACSSVFILLWILGGACPCLNSLVVEWLVFLTVKTERLFKSHANHFESHIHKNSKRGLFKSHVNHFESWASLFPAVTKAVLGLQRSGSWLTFGWDLYTWETNAEQNSTFGTKKEKEKYPCYCARKSMDGNVWDAFW